VELVQHYKNYLIHTSAIHTAAKTWSGIGRVLDPQAKLVREIRRVETATDFVFLTNQEAEEFALKLCKAWIDKLVLYKTM
jgi:hypothetical protein